MKNGLVEPRKGHRWTDNELKEFIAMWLRGIEMEDMAEHFGVTTHAIRSQCYRMRREGVPIPKRNAGHRAGRYNTPWTQEEVEYLIRRRNEKATAEQIAMELDRTFHGVQGMIYKLRKEGVNVRMLGHGIRRLWDPERLRTAIAGRGLRVVGDE